MDPFMIKLFETYIPCLLIHPDTMMAALQSQKQLVSYNVKIQFFRYFFEDFKTVSYDLQKIYEEEYGLKGYHLFFKYFSDDKDEFDKLLDYLIDYMSEVPPYNIVNNYTDKKLERVAPEDRENIRNIIMKNSNPINDIRDYYRQKFGTQENYFVFENCKLDESTYKSIEYCFRQL